MIRLFLPQERNKIYSIGDLVENNNIAYRVVNERLGSGGNAAVYKCVNEATGNEYAIKFLLRYDRHNNKSVKRFERECSILSECSHLHIISLISFGTLDSTHTQNSRDYSKKLYYLIMELSDYGDLMQVIKPAPKIEPERYHSQFRGLAEALSSMHEKNIIHRDIKPENILVIGERWVVSDFGLAASKKATDLELTGKKEKIGPKFWMSPEAINHCIGLKGGIAKIGKSSDVFQLASVFWFAATKKHPLGIPTPKDWPGKKQVYEVLERALQHNPKNRYPDAIAFKDDLIQAIES